MAYEPTHDVPRSGLPAFAAPDPGPGPVAQLDPGLDVQLLERRGDWAHVACSNGWQAWVNGTALVERRAPAPAPPPPAPAGPTPPPPSPSPSPTPPPPAAGTPPSSGPTVTLGAQPLPGGTAEGPGGPAPTPAGAFARPPLAGTYTPPTGIAARPTTGTQVGPGQIIALVGAAIVLISAWLNWGDFQGETASAYEIGSEFLFDSSVEEGKGLLGIGYLVLLAAVLVVVGVFVKQVRFLPIAGGVLAVIVPLLFVFQANNFIDNANDEFDLDIELFDFITYFPFLTVIAGGIAIAGGAMALTQRR